MRPPRGLVGAAASGGRPHGEERQKASPSFPTTGGPYVVRTYGQFVVVKIDEQALRKGIK